VPTPDVSPTERKIVELGEIHRFKPLFDYIGAELPEVALSVRRDAGKDRATHE
jgi:hypothetical protein